MSHISPIDIKARPWRRPKQEKDNCVNKSVKFTVKGLKISQLIDPAVLAAADLVPIDGPAGQPEINLELEGSDLRIRATLNGKSLRRVLKVIAENGPANVHVVLQGIMKPYSMDGPGYVLDGAGLAATPKGRPAIPPAEDVS